MKFLLALCVLISGCSSSQKNIEPTPMIPGPYDMRLDNCLGHEKFMRPDCHSTRMGE